MEGEILCVYVDPDYPLRPLLQAPYKGIGLTIDQLSWRKSVSSVRVAVGWVFGDIANYFKFIDCKKNLKVHLSVLGGMYVCCALIHNPRTCLYQSTTSNHFQVD